MLPWCCFAWSVVEPAYVLEHSKFVSETIQLQGKETKHCKQGRYPPLFGIWNLQHENHWRMQETKGVSSPGKSFFNKNQPALTFLSHWKCAMFMPTHSHLTRSLELGLLGTGFVCDQTWHFSDECFTYACTYIWASPARLFTILCTVRTLWNSLCAQKCFGKVKNQLASC